MKKNLDNPYDLMTTLLALLRPLTESNLSKNEILSSGILEEWIDTAIEFASDSYSNTTDQRIVSLSFMTECWILFPNKIEE